MEPARIWQQRHRGRLRRRHLSTIELVSILDDKDGISTGTSAAIGQVNLDNAGYGIVLVFIIAWLFSLLIWRYGRVEEKWAISDSPSDDPGVTQL